MRRVHFKNLPSLHGRTNLHVTRLRGGQLTAAHDHDFFELFLVLEGGATHHLDRKTFDIEAGHLVALRPEDAHWFSTAPTQTLVFVNLAVSTPWWRAFHTLLGLKPWLTRPLCVRIDTSDTRRLGDELVRVGDGASPLALCRLLETIHHRFTRPAVPSEALPPAWLENLRHHLATTPEALGEPISFWQKRAGHSPEHIARSCRRFYGVTLTELINQARVERARHLLRTTDSKIITIAFESGFENLANFHRVFSRQTGMTPGRWRQEPGPAVPVHSKA